MARGASQPERAKARLADQQVEMGAGGETLQVAADAFAHLKFIAYDPAAMPLLEKAGVARELDEGFIEITEPGGPERFVVACRKLRHWTREPAIKQ